VQFTIRSVMIAILGVAGLLGLARVRPELLPVVIFVAIPVVALTERLVHVPPHRPGWRVWIAAAIGGFAILGAGWFWARAAMWYFQRQGAPDAVAYEYWAGTIPAYATGIALIIYVLTLACICWRQPRRRLLWLVFPYAAVLAFACFFLFLALGLEAFFD
jgi:hypothetical protein